MLILLMCAGCNINIPVCQSGIVCSNNIKDIFALAGVMSSALFATKWDDIKINNIKSKFKKTNEKK